MSTRRSAISRLGALSAALALSPARAFAAGSSEAPRDRAIDEWDLSWLDDLKGRHKQVFDCGSLDEDLPPTHVITNWLNAHRDVFGLEHPQVDTIAGIAFSAFPLNASDALWKKYGLGELWNLHDPATGEWALRHIFYEPPPDAPATGEARRFAEMTVKALQARGTIFWQCNNALFGIAAMLSERTGQEWEPVYNELKGGLVPGVRLVPAHTMLIGLAQERGCTYEKV